MGEPSSKERHKQRHKELFAALDELIADFFWHNRHNRKLLDQTTVVELIE